ncbi:MAG TPA: hypothetical protein PK573_00430 [Spirochaetota bacterium]|nr:hypothetical protein [Spirochaetota bacterium]HRZ26364.1 hypothetical protein [Spirochaetota bacterium]HSA13332.1 hypothetical protein [Spirochaetota bacterium]
MEVGTTLNLIQRATNSSTDTISVRSPNHESIAHVVQESPAIEEKTMMDLQDVQRFLYMLIGSKIKVSNEQNAIGNRLNEVA